jgi:hypothetical protein
VLAGWGAMYLVAGAPIVLILSLGGLAIAGGVAAYTHSQHFARRIDGFLTAEVDARSQLGFATSAIQEGGLFGMGVGEGQVKWQLPDAHTDFIIAVAAEEYGFLLVAFVIVLYATICLRALSRLTRERDPFIRIAGTGIVAVFSASGDDQHGRRRPPAARQGHDAALRQLWRLVAGGDGHHGRHAPRLDAHPSAGRDWRDPCAGRRQEGMMAAERSGRAPLAVLAAGGTGGHMFPAQALAEALLARGWRVELSTDERGARYAGAFPDAVARRIVPSATPARGETQGRFDVPLRISSGVLKAAGAMLRDRPRVVVGFGGYPSIPALGAAFLLRIPRLIHEQNGVLGRVNEGFARRVTAVACGAWPTQLPAGVPAVYVGNPCATRCANAPPRPTSRPATTR